MFSISNSTTDFFVVKRAFPPAQDLRQLRCQPLATLLLQFLRHAVERLGDAAGDAARVSLSPPRDTAVRSACRDKGFTVDYNKGDNYYRANNDAGWQVSIDYEGNQIMSIRIDAPDTSSGSTTSEPSPDSSTSSATAQNDGKLVNGMRKDFKEAMDSYEAFMNEYVAFMKKYNANPNDPTLMADYARYMSKYADACEKFNKWESADMNDAETAYYIDVQARVSKKLLEAAG